MLARFRITSIESAQPGVSTEACRRRVCYQKVRTSDGLLASGKKLSLQSISLGREVPPEPWNSDPFCDKKVCENHGKLILCLWISGQIPLIFFRRNVWFLDLFIKNIQKSLKLRLGLWAAGRKTIPLKGGTSPYSLCMGVPPPPVTNLPPSL